MRVLLDTHALIWWVEDDARLGPHARRTIADRDSSVWVSAASIWELAIKSAIGRLDLAQPLEAGLLPEIERNGFARMPIDFRHALTAADLPRHHSDPFDRILVAQAQCEGMTIVTSDASIRAYDVRSIDASV